MSTLTSTAQLSVESELITKSNHGYFHTLAAYGLIAIGVGFIGMLVLVFHVSFSGLFSFSPPIIFTVSAFTFASIMLYSRWRWTPILAIIFALVEIIFNFERILNVMAAAAGGPDFYLATAILPMIVVTIIAGILALFFNYTRKSQKAVSRWGSRALYTLVGVVLGVYFLYFLLPDSKAALAGTTSVMPTLNILTPEEKIKIEAGKPTLLRVNNESPFAIALHIDELGVHTVMPSGESFIPVYSAKPGQYRYVGSMRFHQGDTPAQGQRIPSGKLLEGVIVAE